MATAAPHVKLLRQLASAKDDYLSGAFDISWDGAKATLYLVFGRPSHAVFETDQEQIEGEAAIDALLAALPRAFAVSDWRRAMSPHETLSITIDELAGPFVRLAGSYADDPVTDEDPEWWSAVDDSPELPFGLADFPLLPGGRPLWMEASPEEVHLSDRLAELPPSILILTGAKLRAAAVVSGGDLIDAVWIDSDDHARGETAGMALLGATKGSLAGYALDDPRVAEALTMLWRLPVAVSGVELSWLDPASMLAAFRADGLDRVLVIDAPVRGIALFSRGGLVAVYSETQRSAVASPERLRSLLSQARGRLTVMERKPRPLAAEPAGPVSAQDFFEVAPVEPESPAQPAADSAVATVDEPEEAAAIAAPEHEAAPAEAAVTSGDAEPTAAALEFEPAAADTSVPPPPPPPDKELAAPDAPPPPLPAAEASEPTQKSKRSRWGFRRSRKSRAEKKQTAEEAAPAVPASAALEEADTSTFSGWRVRQPNEDPQPVWQRSHDAPQESVSEGPEAEAGSDETSAPAWSALAEGDATADAAAHPGAEASAPAAPDDAEQTETPVALDDAAPAPVTLAADDDEHAEVPVAADPHQADAGFAADDAAPADSAASFGERPAAADEADHGFEFASLDEPKTEPAPQASSETWLSDSWLDDVVSGDAPQAAHDPDLGADPIAEGGGRPDTSAHEDEAEDGPIGESEQLAEPRSAPVLRTPGPWSWPLAEPDDDPQPSPDEHDADMEPAVVAASKHEDSARIASENEADSGFFHRDEPVGSQYVDFDEVRNELVQIGVVWLGEANAVQVTALLTNTRSTIDDFVATIDTIRGLHIDGQDPASIQAMAREMHQQAAERLCGA
jgi:hypothetical protein